MGTTLFMHAAYESMPVEEIPGLSRAVTKVLTLAGIPAPQPGLMLHGSTLRRFWSRERVNDVNLACTGPDALAEYRRVRGRPGIGVAIARDFFESPEALLETSDFTIDAAVYHDRRLYLGERFFAHMAQRLLVPSQVDATRAPRMFLRTFKLISRGFTMTIEDFARIVMALEPSRSTFAGLDVTGLTDGRVLPCEP